MAGVPVIATNWSGNVDFCPPDCTFTVDYALIPFRDSHPDYEDVRDARREEIRKTATKRRAAMLVPTIAVLAPVMMLFIAAPLPSIVFGSR